MKEGFKRVLVETNDGSKSLYLPDWNESYHSKHGAVQEALHVFIQMGLEAFEDPSALRILEMGYGSGLNCLLTYARASQRNLKIQYTGIEAFPLEPEVVKELKYTEAIGREDLREVYDKMTSGAWETALHLSETFSLTKKETTFDQVLGKDAFDLVYFDAFGPRVQPELWDQAMFERMYEILSPGGILVTYCAKGSVRRAMIACGFEVERLPGPPGKREMLRARKIVT